MRSRCLIAGAGSAALVLVAACACALGAAATPVRSEVLNGWLESDDGELY